MIISSMNYIVGIMNYIDSRQILIFFYFFRKRGPSYLRAVRDDQREEGSEG